MGQAQGGAWGLYIYVGVRAFIARDLGPPMGDCMPCKLIFVCVKHACVVGRGTCAAAVMCAAQWFACKCCLRFMSSDRWRHMWQQGALQKGWQHASPVTFFF